MSRDINITGGDDLFAALQALPVKLEKNIMRGAMRAGAKLMLEDARAKCPVSPPSGVASKKYGAKEGELRDSLRISTGAKNGKVYAFVKAGNKAAFYARMVEYGTVPHEEPLGAKHALMLGGTFRDAINHPGADAHAFKRPAFYGNADNSIAQVADYIGARLDKLDDSSGNA